MTGEVAVKLKQLGLPLPAALGIFSGIGDFARAGDSASIYSLRGLSGHLAPPEPSPHDPYYVGNTDPTDPVLSPIYADLHGLPPTLFVTGERGEPAPRFPARGSRRPARGLRRDASRILV
jgi:acetyl esterase/lipase